MQYMHLAPNKTKPSVRSSENRTIKNDPKCATTHRLTGREEHSHVHQTSHRWAQQICRLEADVCPPYAGHWTRRERRTMRLMPVSFVKCVHFALRCLSFYIYDLVLWVVCFYHMSHQCGLYAVQTPAPKHYFLVRNEGGGDKKQAVSIFCVLAYIDFHRSR